MYQLVAELDGSMTVDGVLAGATSTEDTDPVKSGWFGGGYHRSSAVSWRFITFHLWKRNLYKKFATYLQV